MVAWHGLAKLRIHSEITLELLQVETVRLGEELRRFQKDVCPHYDTYESDRETQARIRAAAARAHAQGKAQASEGSGGKKRKAFNLQTSKIHALGDYVEEIRLYGTTDGYSTHPVRCRKKNVQIY